MQVLSTTDFRQFQVSPMAGPGAWDKGLALFPRRIGGRYAALSRADRESNLLALSDDRAQRSANLRADSIERDWTTSLAPTVDALVERFAAVMRSGDVR